MREAVSGVFQMMAEFAVLDWGYDHRTDFSDTVAMVRLPGE